MRDHIAGIYDVASKVLTRIVASDTPGELAAALAPNLQGTCIVGSTEAMLPIPVEQAATFEQLRGYVAQQIGDPAPEKFVSHVDELGNVIGVWVSRMPEQFAAAQARRAGTPGQKMVVTDASVPIGSRLIGDAIVPPAPAVATDADVEAFKRLSSEQITTQEGLDQFYADVLAGIIVPPPSDVPIQPAPLPIPISGAPIVVGAVVGEIG